MNLLLLLAAYLSQSPQHPCNLLPHSVKPPVVAAPQSPSSWSVFSSTVAPLRFADASSRHLPRQETKYFSCNSFTRIIAGPRQSPGSLRYLPFLVLGTQKKTFSPGKNSLGCPPGRLIRTFFNISCASRWSRALLARARISACLATSESMDNATSDCQWIIVQQIREIALPSKHQGICTITSSTDNLVLGLNCTHQSLLHHSSTFTAFSWTRAPQAISSNAPCLSACPSCQAACEPVTLVATECCSRRRMNSASDEHDQNSQAWDEDLKALIAFPRLEYHLHSDSQRFPHAKAHSSKTCCLAKKVHSAELLTASDSLELSYQAVHSKARSWSSSAKAGAASLGVRSAASEFLGLAIQAALQTS